jgi:single-stranded-DNA-specific exonuclease
MPYVPHRKLEGYGLSVKGIDNVKKQFNPALIISVDHGITAKEKISYAKSLGISVIVTDHHLKPENLPTDAVAIFHIPELSGAGVAYFFAKQIFQNFKLQITNYKLLEENFKNDYLALASIGSIADLVPLVGSSRCLVKYGLEAFAKVKRHGLRHILKEAGIEGRKITPYEIGFIIAPRINAVGRLEHAIDALRLLCTTNEERAYQLAYQVGSKNIERQTMVEDAIKEARLRLGASADKPKKLPKILFLVSDKWHEGIIGLIASKIAEEYYRPTIVLTESDGFLKGSARSIPSFHITNFLRGLKKYLIDVGGHKGAAGFTMDKKNLTTFETAASKVVNKLIKEKDLERKIEADLKIPLSKINLSLTKSLEKLQPFGIGNPTPTFYSRAEIIDAKMFGKKTEHLKIYVKDKDSFPLELVSFNAAQQFTSLSRGKTIDLVYSLEINRWGGQEKVRGKIITVSQAMLL